jgi:mannose-6-phosphate isomerase
LSIQVHPNDELASKRHQSFGKTEMWYVIQSDENAKIIAGFKEHSNPEEYLKNLESKSLPNILNTIHPNQGDAFLIEAGTIHAIGEGIVVAEIQQTSDVTYRIYDFDRKDKDGKSRELHNELALDSINYNKSNCQKIYTSRDNHPNEIVDCKYFTTNIIPLTNDIEVNKNGNSFTVYMCIEGSFQIKCHNQIYSFSKGNTVLIPALLKSYSIEGTATLLEIYIS